MYAPREVRSLLRAHVCKSDPRPAVASAPFPPHAAMGGLLSVNKCGVQVLEFGGHSCAVTTGTLTTDMEQTLKSTCVVPSQCQTLQIGEIDLGNVDCGDIEIGNQAQTMSFDCSSSMAAMSALNIMNNLANSAQAFIGENSDAVTNVDITTTMKNTLTSQCGGILPSQGGGACKTGVTQQEMIPSIDVGDGKGAHAAAVKCDTMKIANQTSNDTVHCILSEVSKADASISNTVTNSATASDWIASFMGPFILIAIVFFGVLLFGGKMVSGSMKGVTDTISHLSPEQIKAYSDAAQSVMGSSGGKGGKVGELEEAAILA